MRFLAAVLLGLVALATDAAADTIRMKSGRTLNVDAVEVLEDRVRVAMQRDGETVHVEFAFDKFTPRTVLKLFDRTNDADDVRACLRGARIALRVGLHDEAERRFRAAGTLDPAFDDEVRKGLDEVLFARATQAFRALEARLRKGKDPAAVHKALEALLVGPHAMYLTIAQIRRIEVLSKLARRMAERAARKKANQKKKREHKKRPPAPRKRPDNPPKDDDETDARQKAPESYADERERRRKPHRPRTPPKVPGRARPPLQGSGGGVSVPPRGQGSGRSSGGNSGSGGGRGLGLDR